MSIFTAQRYASEVYAVVVHVSVCVSVTRRYCIRTAKHRIISKVADFNLSDLHLAPPPVRRDPVRIFPRSLASEN